MPSYVKDACPVCGCGEYRDMGAVHAPHAPVPVPSDSKIVNCRQCRSIYVNPMPHWSGEDFEKLYDRSYFSHLQTEEKEGWQKIRQNHNPRERFERIAPHLKSDQKTLLEIGAGECAYLCRYLADKGWQVTAQEPGTAYQEKLRALGLTVEGRGVMELDGEGKYALIYADSVLEHVPNPVDYYKKLAALLTPGGVLYTISPNEYSLCNFVLNLRAKAKGETPHYIAPYQEPYHLVGFTKKALEVLGQQSGLTLAEYRKPNDYMAYHALSGARSPLVKYPAAGVLALSQMVGLGMNAEALFVKRFAG